MNNYKLKENEVVLYKGDVTLSNKNSKRLILTNLNIVLIDQEDNVSIEIYPIEDIKLYQGQPQIKKKGNLVEIYLLSTEIDFVFNSKIELNKFISEAIKLLTGKTAVERGAEKVKNAIKLVDDTLGINTVSAVGSVVKDGVVGKGFKKIGKIIKK